MVEWISRRRDEIGLAIALLVVSALLFGTSVTTILDGLDHADDAYFAMVAKSLATGRGYGLPRSSERFVAYEPNVGMGPTMTVPLAGVIAVAGLRERLPGILALVIFAALLIAAAAVIARQAGVTVAAATGAMFILLLVVTSRVQWLYGVFMGEPVAAGFILLAALVLGTTVSRRAAFAAGVVTAAAVLTKLIAVFAAAGMTIALLIMAARDRRIRVAVLRIGAYVIGGAIPILLFEATKLWTLGLPEYVANWQTTLAIGSTTGVAIADPLERFARWATSVGTRFVSVGVAVSVVVVLALTLWRGRARPVAAAAPWLIRTIALLSAGAIAHVAYLATRATVSPRYLLIGLLSLLAIAALGTIIVRPRVRIAALAVILASAVALDPQSVAFDRTPDGGDAHADRLAVVARLDEQPTVPYAADHWPTLYQFVFPRPNEGRYAYGVDVGQFLDEPLLAVVDTRYSLAGGHFITAVEATCQQMTASETTLYAYACGEAFWDAYLPPSRFAVGWPTFAATAQDGGACNVDWYDDGAPTGQPIVVERARRAAIDGWALDAQGGEPNRAMELVLEKPGGSSYHAAVAIEPRPDIAKTFGQPAAVQSGFRGALDHDQLVPGQYRLFVVMDTARGGIKCDTRVTLDVR